jgi:hypothetical protein
MNQVSQKMNNQAQKMNSHVRSSSPCSQTFVRLGN